jgi:hypothetical protein
LNSGDGIGDAESAIVVGMDANFGFWESGPDGADDGGYFRWKAASVRVAEDEVIGSSLRGGFESSERVVGIGRVAVKEVFGIVDGFTALFFEEGDSIGDHAKVFCGGSAENFFDVKEPAFSEDGNNGGFRFEEETDLGVVGGFGVGATGGAKGGEFAGAPTKFSCFDKEISIFVVGTRPTAFHIVETVGGEPFGEAKLIGKGEVNALALSAITQSSVVDGKMGSSGHRGRG